MSPTSGHEQKRIEALKSLQILDTIPEQVFDDITFLASQICETPIALISLVDEDRQFFKSHYGLEVSETPRSQSFCAHAIKNPTDLFQVFNASEDERFKDNPLVTSYPNIAFYMGLPLVSNDGFAYGTLCVIDSVPRVLNDVQIKCLEKLKNQVITLFSLRKQSNILKNFYETLSLYSKDMEDFAFMVAHDLKEPTKMISALTMLLKRKYDFDWDDEDLEFFNGLEAGAVRIESFIEGLLEYAQLSQSEIKYEDVDLNKIIQSLINQFELNEFEESINWEIADFPILNLPKVMISIVLSNLINNAIKYRKRNADLDVSISFTLLAHELTIYVKDNGIGIPKNQFKKIFQPFKRLEVVKASGHGFGLASCAKIMSKIGGLIALDSELNVGTTFILTIPLNKN
uniref:GAF domain-containing sensor histidine kinase n=1 Tax=Flavobacterium sp. TaxID=239 RepID=UPI00404AEC47